MHFLSANMLAAALACLHALKTIRTSRKFSQQKSLSLSIVSIIMKKDEYLECHENIIGF